MNNGPFYAERESKSLEFKEKLPKFSALIKTCVAFSNGVGGKIIIGIEDNSRKVVGISEESRNRLYESFPNSLYDSTTPSLVAELYEKNIDDKMVAVIEIAPCTKKPSFVTKEGVPEGVYLRVGSSTRKANLVAYEDLLRESQRKYYDEEAVSTANEKVLSNAEIKDCYGTNVNKRRLMNDGALVQSQVESGEFYPTVTGLLMFHHNPQQFVPEAVILCSRFAGTSGRKILQTEEIVGTLLEQAQQSLALLKMWLLRDYSLKGPVMTGKLLVPEQALREAIINALIHRKYSIPGAIKIALYDDRLEIFSPGGFPGLVDINNLGDGTTYLRNPTLARFARKVGLVEKLGTGIRLIFASCKKAGVRSPEFCEEGDYVRLTFFFAKIKSATELPEQAILKLFNEREQVSVRDVMQVLDISRNTATRYLGKLVAQKKLLRQGKGPSVRYLTCSS